jgi:hypothetical protein
MVDTCYNATERKGNRLDAPVLSDKTTALGWEAEYFLKDYIKRKVIKMNIPYG